MIISIINRPNTETFEKIILKESQDKKFNYLSITSMVGHEMIEKETQDTKKIYKLLSYFKNLKLKEYNEDDYNKKGKTLENRYIIYFNNSNNYEYIYLSLSYEKNIYIRFHTLTDHGSKILEKRYLIKNRKIDEPFLRNLYKNLKPIDE